MAKQGEGRADEGGMTDGRFVPPTWRTPEGKAVSCLDKIKVLNENLEEIRALAQEALEDAVLMGCDEEQFRNALKELSQGIVNPYRKGES
jgi:hypothetical protein